jgi:hypothetical protein
LFACGSLKCLAIQQPRKHATLLTAQDIIITRIFRPAGDGGRMSSPTCRRAPCRVCLITEPQSAMPCYRRGNEPLRPRDYDRAVPTSPGRPHHTNLVLDISQADMGVYRLFDPETFLVFLLYSTDQIADVIAELRGADRGQDTRGPSPSLEPSNRTADVEITRRLPEKLPSLARTASSLALGTGPAQPSGVLAITSTSGLRRCCSPDHRFTISSKSIES